MFNTKSQQKKEEKWFQSSFDFSVPHSAPKKPRMSGNIDSDDVIQTKEVDVPITRVQNFDWLDKYKPNNLSDLAVNNKKVQEVEDWLSRALNVPGSNSILLLSGPSGCGKTATVQVLAKKLGVTISEWVTPVDIELIRDLGSNSYSYQEKQTNKFLDFLLKASRFKSLLSGSNRIILVEDYPNIFLKETSEFHDILQKYRDRGRSPLIFICTDSNDGNSSLLWNLFPQHIIEKHNIHHISFNPIAVTGMKQALKRIISLVGNTNKCLKIPDQECIEMIINSSMGDIRSAVNNLCFASINGRVPMESELITKKPTKGKDNKKSKDKSQAKLKSIGRNESLSVMHGVGRVLNPKFAEKLKANDLNRYTHSPESIVEHFEIQPVSFVGYLHENYLPHFATIGDVVAAADMLSDADCFLNEWRDKYGKTYGLFVAVSGLMVANKTPVSSWHPVRGAKKANVVYPSISDIPLLDRNQMLCGKVLATDYKGYCSMIAKGDVPSADTSTIEEYNITEYEG